MVQRLKCRQGAVRCSQLWQELLQRPAQVCPATEGLRPSPVLAKAAAHGKAVEGQGGEVVYRSLPQLQRQAAVHHAIYRLLPDVRQVRFQAARDWGAIRFGVAGSSWRNRIGRGRHRQPNTGDVHPL